MTEPTQPITGAVSLITLAVALFGPQAGPYVVIVLGSVGGALWALSRATLPSRAAGAWLMVRCVVTAIALTALVAEVVGHYFGFKVVEAYVVVAFCIGMLGNDWQDIFATIKTRIQVAITSSGGRPS